jgi:hypothetical protein
MDIQNKRKISFKNLSIKQNILLILSLVILLSLPIAIIISNQAQDIKNFAQGTNEVDLRFTPVSLDIQKGSNVVSDIKIFKTATRNITSSGAQAILNLNSAFSNISASCVAPFNGMPFVRVNGNQVTVLCGIAFSANPVSLNANGTSFARVSFTVNTNASLGAAPVVFTQTRVTEAGVVGQSPDVSTAGITANFNIVAGVSVTLTPTVSPSLESIP